jgi:hypothetical protein
VHAQLRTGLRRVGLVMMGLGTFLREAAAGVLFVSLWMVTFGLMWGMVAVLLGALIEQVAEMVPPGEGIDVEPRLAVWLWVGFLVAYPVRWFVLRLLALRRPAARAAMGQMLSGPLRVWRSRWLAAGADRTLDGAAATGVTTILVAQMKSDEMALDDERRLWLAGRRRRGVRHEPPQRPNQPPPLPIARSRAAGWTFGPPVELPDGPLFTIDPFVGYRRWAVRPSSVVGGSSEEPVLGSAIVDYLWLEPTVTARCWPGRRSRFDPLSPTTHTAPSLDCRCGIYALRDPSGVDWPLDAALCVEGAVELSGTVLEGERGFRAQRAKIVGPLELRTVCEHGLRRRAVRELCPAPPKVGVIKSDRYALACDRHAATLLAGSGEPVKLATLLEMVATKLETRYQVAVLGEGGSWTWT